MKTIHLVLLVSLVTILLYGRTVTFGFDWDDYHFVHAYSWTEITQAFVSSWVPTHLEAPFYRPLTIGFYAVRSWVFGSEPVALHLVSLMLVIAVGWLFASWLILLRWSQGAVLVGLLVFLTHPAMSTSAAVWITNQIHLLQLLLVLTALHLATDRPDRWPSLLFVQALALLVKEDSVMLTPALATLWWTRGQRIPMPWVIESIVLLGIYVLVRTWALGGLGGHPPPDSMMTQWLAAPMGLTGLAYSPPHLVTVGSLALLLALAVMNLQWSAWRPTLVLAGTLFFFFNLPLVLESAPNRWQLVVMAMSVGIAATVQLTTGLWTRRAAYAVSALLLVSLTTDNWATTKLAAPCSGRTRQHDRLAAAWPLQRDMAARLAAKDSQCAAAQGSGR